MKSLTNSQKFLGWTNQMNQNLIFIKLSTAFFLIYEIKAQVGAFLAESLDNS